MGAVGRCDNDHQQLWKDTCHNCEVLYASTDGAHAMATIYLDRAINEHTRLTPHFSTTLCLYVRILFYHKVRPNVQE